MPLIAIAREMGSLGYEVAAVLSENLSIPILHHEIIEQAADKTRVRKSHVTRFLDTKGRLGEVVSADKTQPAIFTASEILEAASSKSGVILHGWGAVHLLRGVDHAVRVRICAPMEMRTSRTMKRIESDRWADVRHEILRSDEAHGAIVRRHFNANWQDPTCYDLVLNTERLSVEACAEAILALARDAEFRETDESRKLIATLKRDAALHEEELAARKERTVRTS